MAISNVNIGLCHRRVQTGEPAFFVNWRENGSNHYKFSSIRSSIETWKNNLLKGISIIN